MMRLSLVGLLAGVLLVAACGGGGGGDSQGKDRGGKCDEREFHHIEREFAMEIMQNIGVITPKDWKSKRSREHAVDQQKRLYDRVVENSSCTHATLEKFLVKMARTKDHKWKLRLATFYSLQKSYYASFTLTHMAAQNGLVEAQIALGAYYWGGVGVSKDLVKAYAWFKVAADQNQPMDEILIDLGYEMSRQELRRANELARAYFREYVFIRER